MIHIQHSTATKPATTKLSTQQIMPLPQQAVFGCAGMLAQTRLSGENLLSRGLAFVGLWSDCEHGLFSNGLFADGLFTGNHSIDSSVYINRLEPTRYRSGERRRLAATPL